MATSFEEAVEALYRAAHDAFVAERKRLAGELKGAGDKAGAARLAKLGRPPISAWAVNQLWWQERDEVERLLAAAARLRKGDQSAATPRRDSLTTLRARAAGILERGGHAPNEGTLRRVTTTLAALAAAGGFEPDPPGALSADRDPPGFDVAGLAATLGGAEGEVTPSASAAVAAAPAQTAPSEPSRSAAKRAAADPKREATDATHEEADAKREAADAKREEADARAKVENAARRAERERREAVQQAERDRQAAAKRAEEERQEAERHAERERVRLAVERAAQRAERQRLEASIPSLRGDLERRLREVERLRAEVERVEQLAEQARSAITEAESRLATLGPD